MYGALPFICLTELLSLSHSFVSGYKFVLSGNLDRQKCISERLQPFPLSSNDNSQCGIVKSQCSGEGQIVFSDGNTTDDRSCRCNYVKNFAFVTKPKAPCYCIPSQEDCSCYYRTCPIDHYLTSGNYQDYESICWKNAEI